MTVPGDCSFMICCGRVTRFMPSIPKPSALTMTAMWCQKPKRIRSILPAGHTCSGPIATGSNPWVLLPKIIASWIDSAWI